jgi:DNA processing protein
VNKTIRTVKTKDFSPLLAEIHNCPGTFQIQGKFPVAEKYLTVVGSRKYSDYGKAVCEYLINGLRGYNICIISGLALGMDGIALNSALYNGLPTIAVPGSGLSDTAIHPKTNIGIRDAILESGGCILSEFPDDFRATLYSFPQRNRIMAGLAHATLIIEAEIKSGTLITSKYATEYNRDVFTVPHPIFSPTSEGPHMLLRLGATPITKPEDILDAFNMTPKDPKAFGSGKRDYSDCSDDEVLVVNLLIRTLGKPTHTAQAILSIMEIKGLIKEEMGEIRLI